MNCQCAPKEEGRVAVLVRLDCQALGLEQRHACEVLLRDARLAEQLQQAERGRSQQRLIPPGEGIGNLAPRGLLPKAASPACVTCPLKQPHFDALRMPAAVHFCANCLRKMFLSGPCWLKS